MKRLSLVLLFFISLPTWAQRQFDVEVIIFKRTTSPAQVEEAWPNNLAPINKQGAATFSNQSYLNSKGVRLLPSSSYQLNDDASRIANHSGFKVLFHKAWRQGDQGKGSAPEFRILAGQNFASRFNSDGSSKSAQTTAQGFNETPVSGPLYELDGTLQVYVQHYLYLDTSLDLKEPGVKTVRVNTSDSPLTNDNSDNAGVEIGHLADIKPNVKKVDFLKSYRLNQVRRMRSSETHYLDNPLMGMIIQVRKVQ
ncbi:MULTISPECIES: peptidoglycan binding protein CsiV [unclassified Vibrio]|uniref:Peptidoglycan binding protein CsiV n=1 Tax=Vibrio sp. HB236076 TaxID=3232307 RepID=A0AB39HHX2_9VIBR|nr:peptidoglycan binding protein CsiV [Vibrio sp. HB161653]MDP5255115.1 peptidoglycan binding protein CsiV [Vibrio sp. HB161653]